MTLHTIVDNWYDSLIKAGYTPKEVREAIIDLIHEVDLNESIAEELNKVHE